VMIDHHAWGFEHDYQPSTHTQPSARCFDLEPGALSNLCEYQVDKLILMPSDVPERDADGCKQQDQPTREHAKEFHTLSGLGLSP